MTGTPAPAVYELAGVRVAYGGRTVLAVPSLTIARGETLGIIGPSGAGKSTLLRLLQFLEPPTAGDVRFEGAAIRPPAPQPVMHRITTVFQRSVMLDRSVRANVAFGQGLRGRRDPPRVDRLLEDLALGPLAHRNARTLSGGEMQRVALARALAVDPEVLLLDEPAANLDPAHVALVESLVRAAQARGTTIVLVTHNTHEARRLASRTALLIGGDLVEVAPTAALFDAPAQERTRAFLAGDLIY